MKLHFFGSWRLVPFVASGLLLTMTCFAGGANEVSEPLSLIGPIGPISPITGPKVPELSGTFTKVSIKPNTSGSMVRIKGLLTLLNAGTKAAKKVTASVYLTPDSTLSADAQPLIVLKLASFNDGDGKVKSDHPVTIPIKYKLPALLAAGLSGQYVIIVLAGENVPRSAANDQIVYGPLPKVP